MRAFESDTILFFPGVGGPPKKHVIEHTVKENLAL